MDLEILILSEVSQMEEDTHHIISLTYGILQEMATHSSMLAWKIPWARSLGGYSPRGRKTVRHDWATEQQYVEDTHKNDTNKLIYKIETDSQT